MIGLSDVSKYVYTWVYTLKGFWDFFASDSITVYIDDLIDRLSSNGDLVSSLFGVALEYVNILLRLIALLFTGNTDTPISLLSLMLGGAAFGVIVYSLIKWLIP